MKGVRKGKIKEDRNKVMNGDRKGEKRERGKYREC
jgi:hypothetical protein